MDNHQQVYYIYYDGNDTDNYRPFKIVIEENTLSKRAVGAMDTVNVYRNVHKNNEGLIFDNEPFYTLSEPMLNSTSAMDTVAFDNMFLAVSVAPAVGTR